jgi:hypothetical protein
MISKFTVKPSPRCQERGSLLPVVLGIGLMASLVATTMILRADDDQVNIVTTNLSARSKAAAELGITRYMNLINTYRDIASVDACGDNSLETTGNCTDGTTDSWHNPTAVVDAAAVSLISAQASGDWRDIDPNDPTQGQFRLISYAYNGTDTGTLTIEGRVNQFGAGNQATEGNGTATTRLRVGFPVLAGTGFGGEALWIGCNEDTNVTTTGVIAGNIKDSTPLAPCGGIDPNVINDLQAHQPANTPPFTYEPSSDPFPALPTEGQLANVPGTGVCTISAVNNSNPPNPGGPGNPDTVTFPAIAQTEATLCAEGTGTYYTYHLTNTPSIQLTGPRVLRFDAPGETIRLYVTGKITINNGDAGFAVTPGTTLVIYAHDEVWLTGGSNVGGPVNNPGTTDNIQLYVYGGGLIKLTGGSTAAKMFIFAPSSEVAISSFANGAIQGVVWAYSYAATGDSSFFGSTGDINCANLKFTPPAGLCGGGNQIGPINSWANLSR